MVKPEATIAICFRNPGPPFRLALQSVFAQTCPDWELILLNDISTDGSLELAESIRDPRVRVYSDGDGKSFNVRLNEMVQLANGRYFFRMDADDVMLPQRVERQLELLRKYDDNTVIGSGVYSINKQSRVIGFRGVNPQRQDFRARHSFHHPTVAATKAWFERNPYSEQYIYQRSEDAELWCRTTATSKFVTVAEPLMFYREASSSFGAYIGTELVLLHILRERFRNPRFTYLKLLTIEMAKLWSACVLDAFGRLDLLFRRRYQALDSIKMAEAQALLDRIAATVLPGTTFNNEPVSILESV